jgi:hypothetical protein
MTRWTGLKSDHAMNKKTLIKENTGFLKAVYEAEDVAERARDAMKANVAAYFGVDVGDEVECTSGHRGVIRGVVRSVRFHFPMRGTKVTSVGSIHVRPWATKGHRKLIQSCRFDACFTDRSLVKLIAKSVEEGRKFIR